jgi:hypothetical protein
MDLNIEKTMNDLNDIEGLLGGGDDDVQLSAREGLTRDFWRQIHLKESLLKQRSRV